MGCDSSGGGLAANEPANSIHVTDKSAEIDIKHASDGENDQQISSLRLADKPEFTPLTENIWQRNSEILPRSPQPPRIDGSAPSHAPGRRHGWPRHRR